MDAVAQLNASLAGRYAVEREIGRGGMAAVYLARDVRHHRPVALKVLNPEIGAVLGVERFLAEIRVTANLQHPNLLPLFDSGEAEGLLFYVMPYVEGESLRARLQREKQLPVDDAVHTATAVASALDYAHRHGIVHRDLKPENILIHEGQPLVADFGIALAVHNAGGARITQTGISLGTPHYMSPEQATGDRVIDARADVYSLGAVLYEMLTGEPPHTGTTAQAVIARVLTDKARPIRHTRETVPVHVEAAVERALAKLPADRFQTAREFADAIAGKAVVLPRDIPMPSSLVFPRRSRGRRIARASLLMAPWMVVGGLAAMLLAPRHDPTIPTTRFALSLPPSARLITTTGGFIEVAPTGDGFVYVGQAESGPRLFHRALHEEEVRSIPGTDNGAQPFMSPDGAWVGFIAEGLVRKVALRSGASQTVANLGADAPTGFAWGAAGRIVYGRLGGGMMQVPANGGAPAPFTTLAPGETSHRGPAFLDDNRTVAFVAWGASPNDGRIAFVRWDGAVMRTSQHAVRVRQIARDLIAFSNAQGTIFAAPFNPATLEIGEASALESQVFVRASGFSAWGASTNGTLVFLRGEPSARLTLVNRSGGATSAGSDVRSFGHPKVSPDGKRIATHIGVGNPGTGDIWVYSLDSETLSRVTFGGGNSDPLWSRDGRFLLFSGRAGPNNPENDLYRQRADGSSRAERIFTSPGRQWASGWSTDGRTIVLDELVQGSITRLSALRVGDSVARPLVQAPAGAIVRFPSLSPDGRFMAYASNESGRMEVYVTRFPEADGKWQVSTRGGDEPQWSRSGLEIFFRDNSHVVAARISTAPTFSVLSRTPLFEDTYMRANTVSWDVMADDQRFVMLRAADQSAQLIVLTNWDDEVRRRVASSP